MTEDYEEEVSGGAAITTPKASRKQFSSSRVGLASANYIKESTKNVSSFGEHRVSQSSQNRNKGNKVRSSMGLINAGKKVMTRQMTSDGAWVIHEDSVSMTNTASLARIVSQGSRGRNTLLNPDGSKMTSDDFVRNGYAMRDTGCAPAIHGFGLSQTAL